MTTLPPGPPVIVKRPVNVAAEVRALSQERKIAMAEQDKAHLNDDRQSEAIAYGKVQAYVRAVALVAGLNSDALALALLDALDTE